MQYSHGNQFTGLHSEVVTDFRRLSSLAADWERLRLASPRPEVFMSFHWARACWRAFGQDRKLRVVVITRDGRLVGILPLVIQGDTLRFLASPNSDYNDLLAAKGEQPELLESSMRTLFASDMNWKQCILENVPSDSNIHTMRQWLPLSFKLQLVETSRTVCPALVRLHEDGKQIDAILRNSRNRRTVKRLARDGDLVFRHLQDPDEIRQHLPEFFRQHIRRWALAGHKSQFLQLDQRSLYENLLDEFGSDAMKFSVLELNRRPIAYHLGFETHGKYIFYKPTFDVDFWEHSPGTVLLLKIVEYIEHHNMKELDFATGGEWYKSRFSNFSRENHKIILFKSSISAARANILVTSKKLANYLASGRPWATSIISTGNELRRMSLSKEALLRLRRRTKLHVITVAERELYIVSASSYAAAVACGPRIDETITVRSGNLKDLADLAVEALGDWDITRLHDARMRLKRGDRLLLVERRGEIEQLAWLAASGDLLSSFSTLPNRTARCKQSPQILYDYQIFTRNDDPSSSATGFCELIRAILDEISEVLISVRGDVAESIKILEAGCVRVTSSITGP